MARKQSADTLRQAANSLIHAIDPPLWVSDCLPEFTLDQWQIDFLRGTDQRTCLMCSRRSGKSACTALLATHTAVFRPGSLTLIVCPAERQSTEMLKSIKGFLAQSTVNQKPERNAETSIELSNKSRVISIPASPDTIRGLTPDLVVMDECQGISDETDAAIRPMLASKSRKARIVKLGTPAACAGNFFEAAHSPNWKVFKVTAYQSSRLDEDYLAQELYENGELYFNREYLVQFGNSEFSFFNSDIINAAFDTQEEPLKLRLFT